MKTPREIPRAHTMTTGCSFTRPSAGQHDRAPHRQGVPSGPEEGSAPPAGVAADEGEVIRGRSDISFTRVRTPQGQGAPHKGQRRCSSSLGLAPSRPRAAHDHVTDFSRAPTGSSKDATCPQSHSYLAEACSSWQGRCPTSHRLAFQKPLAISGDGWASTGMR